MAFFKDSKAKWLFLTVGILSYLLSGPVLQIGIAGWFIPIGILYFTRSSRPLRGYLWAVLFMMVVYFFGSILTSPLPWLAVLISAPIAAFPEMLPYLFDRILYRRVHPVLAVFILPVVGLSSEFLLSKAFSTIGLLAATQTQFVEFTQIASIFGVWGISFMIYWMASTLVPVLQNQWNAGWRTYAVVFSVLLLFGFIRTRGVEEVQETVKVSGITIEEYRIWEAIYKDVTGEEIEIDIEFVSSPEMVKVLNAFPEVLKDARGEKFVSTRIAVNEFADLFLRLTKSEAENGSKIIVWSETNLPVFKEDEAEFLERVKSLAQQEKVIISAAMAVLLPFQEGGPMYENKSVLFTPEGEMADMFHKAKPVPFLDSSLPGSGILNHVETDYGTITQAICYDADFPALMRQASGADILLLPSNDWLGISPYHGDNSSYRAIENGVSIVRPTGSGQSVVFDPYGNALTRLDGYDQEVRIINAYVPVQGVFTVYSVIGDILVWLSLAGVIMFMGLLVISLRGVQSPLLVPRKVQED